MKYKMATSLNYQRPCIEDTYSNTSSTVESPQHTLQQLTLVSAACVIPSGASFCVIPSGTSFCVIPSGASFSSVCHTIWHQFLCHTIWRRFLERVSYNLAPFSGFEWNTALFLCRKPPAQMAFSDWLTDLFTFSASTCGIFNLKIISGIF